MAKRKEIEAKIKELQAQLEQMDTSKEAALKAKLRDQKKAKVAKKAEELEPDEVEDIDAKIPSEYAEEMLGEETESEEPKEEPEEEPKEELEEQPEEEPKEESKEDPKEEPKPEAEAKVALVKPVPVDCYRADGPGKAYKYWDFERRFYCLTTDLWAAMQAGGNTWEPVWVWYQEGQINHVMDKKEIQKYLP